MIFHIVPRVNENLSLTFILGKFSIHKICKNKMFYSTYKLFLISYNIDKENYVPLCLLGQP